MFANPTQVGISQRVVATLVASALVLWSFGVHLTAQAADLPNISNTLSDSDPGATPSHTIEFDIPAGSVGVLATDQITITFDSQDDGGVGQDFTGIAGTDIADLSATVTGVGNSTGFDIVTATGDDIVVDGIVASAGDTVEIVVASGVITNPSTVDSYELLVDIANADSDSGRTRVAIVDNVLVSAVVETVFDFTISGTAAGRSVNGTTTTDGSTPTTIDFGTLVANELKTIAQQLNVTTNARNGFVVTVESDGYLQSGNGAVIDNFIGTAEVSAPGTTWSNPANDIGDDRTWGHWGLTTSDSDIGTLGTFYGSTNFGANEYIAATTTPREIFHHDGPTNGVAADSGSTTVAYQIAITPLQEAADDYNTILTYIATPTF